MTLDGRLLRWAVAAAAPGADVTEVRGLRDGGSPWLLQLSLDGHGRGVVLRVGRDPAPLQTEVAALQLAEQLGVPAPRLVAADLDGDPPVVLTERLAGSSTIPVHPSAVRLRALGAAAAALHAVPLSPALALPRRERPIAGEDFAALRRAAAPDPLLIEAEEAIDHRPVPGEEVFVHGDLWQGNVLWTGDHLIGLVDWTCAGAGPAGVDIGSLRCDAALCYGLNAVDDILEGWEEAHRPSSEGLRVLGRGSRAQHATQHGLVRRVDHWTGPYGPRPPHAAPAPGRVPPGRPRPARQSGRD